MKPQKQPSKSEIDAAERELNALVTDPTLIAGIYNYCDRWCERCPLSNRCLTYKMEQARSARRAGRRESKDRENRAFWEDLSESFALAARLIRREAKKLGIDLDSPSALVEAEAGMQARRRRAAREGRALGKAANAYVKAMESLLARLPHELRETARALDTQERLGAGDPRDAFADLQDALEVVQWYQHFIGAKLHRAVAGRIDDAIDFPGDPTGDADGSAKVALVAIDRSIGAWVRLRAQLDGEADGILDLLVRLEKLRRAVESEFPRARAFRRPGFD